MSIQALSRSFTSSHLDPAWQRVRNLLVMRLDNIGDVIMTSPALRAIKDNLPQVNITLMASPSGSLAAPLLPWVDQVLPWRVLWQDLGRLAFDPQREWELIHTVHDRSFDAAIIFTSFSQSPYPPGFICELAGIPLRLGDSREQSDATLTTQVTALADTAHQVDRNLHLIESVGFTVPDRRLSLAIPDSAHQSALSHLAAHGLSATDPVLVLNPWTSCPSRNYDAQRFAIAARQLSDITGWKVVVTGVASDRPHSQALLAILGEAAIDVIGATNLSELAALIAHARLMLSNNTSTMHIADATGTPSVILFAGTEYESQWRPRTAPAMLLRQPTACSPCYAFTCPYQLECLDIDPQAIVTASLALLAQ